MTPMLFFGILEIAFLVILALATVIAVVHDARAMKKQEERRGKEMSSLFIIIPLIIFMVGLALAWNYDD